MNSGFDFFSKVVELAKENNWQFEPSASSRRKILIVDRADWMRAAEILRDIGGIDLLFVTVARIKNKTFLIADIKNESHDCISLRTVTTTSDEFSSLNIIWPQADWHEQEAAEDFQVEIKGTNRSLALFRRGGAALEH